LKSVLNAGAWKIDGKGAGGVEFCNHLAISAAPIKLFPISGKQSDQRS
jgi:hypothetical protein